MKQFSDAFRHVLHRDPILQMRVGEDSDGEYKIYEASNVKLDTQAPFLAWSFRLGARSEGTYSDDYTLEYIAVQVTTWGRNPREAWELADAADDALLTGDFSVTPYELVKIRRDGVPVAHPDRDTNWTQIDVLYQAIFGR